MSITKRSSLNRPLTWGELDDNFSQVDLLVNQANTTLQSATQQAQLSAQSATQAYNYATQSSEAVDAAEQAAADAAQSASTSGQAATAAVQGFASDLLSTDVSKGDNLIQVVSPVSGTIPRTQHSKNQDSISILDFISESQLTGDATAALQTALSTRRTVVIPSGFTVKVAPTATLVGYLIVDGTLQVTDNCTFTCGVEVRGGSVNVDSGKIGKFTGDFNAPKVKIFNGTGVVSGLRNVWAEWWGAVADNTTDSTVALKAALACLASSSGISSKRPTLNLLSGNYVVSSTLTVNISANCGMEIAGQGIIFSGTRLVASATFTGDQVMYVPALADGTQRILDFKLRDFGIVPATAGSGATIGLQLGTSGLMMNGLRESHVENLYISNFAYSIKIINGRLIKFSRVGSWNTNLTVTSSNLMIQADGKFAGDLSFENCQFVNTQSISGTHLIYITSNGAYSSAGDRANQVAGIRFTECILYPADQSVYVTALGGSHIEDLFFTTCQWDGDSNTMFYAVASGTGSQVNDVQIVHNYMYGGNKSTAAQIQFVTSSGGNMKNLRVESNTLGNGTGRVVNFSTSAAGDMSGLIVSGNYVVDFSNATQPAVEFGAGCSRIQCSNNISVTTGSSTYPYFIQMDTGSNYYVVTNNLAAGVVTTSTVREVTAGANRVVANNL